MNTIRTCLLVALLGLTRSLVAQGQTYQVLHSFSGYPSDGTDPWGGVILSGSRLYGTTASGGGPTGVGSVFGIGTDGSDYMILHTLDGNNEGGFPYSGLTSDGSFLYGMTTFFGSGKGGTIFKVGTDGSGFTILHSFAQLTSDNGGFPYGNLIRVGSTLFGTTVGGGAFNSGTVFKIGTDGSGFTTLHSCN